MTWATFSSDRCRFSLRTATRLDTNTSRCIRNDSTEERSHKHRLRHKLRPSTSALNAVNQIYPPYSFRIVSVSSEIKQYFKQGILRRGCYADYLGFCSHLDLVSLESCVLRILLLESDWRACTIHRNVMIFYSVRRTDTNFRTSILGIFAASKAVPCMRNYYRS